MVMGFLEGVGRSGSQEKPRDSTGCSLEPALGPANKSLSANTPAATQAPRQPCMQKQSRPHLTPPQPPQG